MQLIRHVLTITAALLIACVAALAIPVLRGSHSASAARAA